MNSKIPREPIAIVGLGCRLPGAPSPQAFWKLLREGTDAIREVPADRWDVNSLHDPDPNSPGKMISRRGGFLDNVDQFDWRAFRIPPREAKYMDPQHRLLLEVAWEALEDAGLPLESVKGSRTGVFMGIMWNDYLRLQSREPLQFNGYAATGNAFAFAPSRISYFFDLRGPSVAIDGACAASLASVHAACQSLWMEETTLALAGGVNLILSPDVNIMLSKAGVLSPDGCCKTLDARADGFVRGEGAGIIVLKLRSQLMPGDRVYAFIRGTALNHNGHNEWIMASDPSAQETVIREALHVAGVEPTEIDYVELHGTGLPKGDPIEATALGAVLNTGTQRTRPCLVGSVKTNIGHLDSASGIAGIIKVALSLYHGEIPPTLHLQHLNPKISMEALGLVAQRTLGPWPAKDAPPLAGVTAISMAGGNAHAVLEAPPRGAGQQSRSANIARNGTKQPAVGEPQILTLSARTPKALLDLAKAYSDFLINDQIGACFSPRDICYTASVRRSHHEYRLALVGHSLQTFVQDLQSFLQMKVTPGVFFSPKVREDLPSLPESGSYPALSEAISRLLDGRNQANSIVSSEIGKEADRQIVLEALGFIYAQGNEVNWNGLYPGENQCTQLPTYPWQRERLWLDWLHKDEEGLSVEGKDVTRDQTSLEKQPSKLVSELRSSLQSAKERPELLRRLEESSPRIRQDILRAYVRDQVVNILGLDPSFPIRPQQGLFDVGLNSLAAVELMNHLETSLGHSLPPTLVFDYPTIESLAEYLAKTVFPIEPSGISQVKPLTDKHPQSIMDLPELEQLSEDEATALLIKKLESIEKKLT